MKKILLRDENNVPIYANVVDQGPKVSIKIDPVSLVRKDNPDFADKEGAVFMLVPKAKYPKIFKSLRGYYEGLLLRNMVKADDFREMKGELEGENRNTGARRSTKRKRNKKSDFPGDIATDKGEGADKSVHTSPGRDEPTA